MPMIDAFIPAGALTSEAENRLMAELTDMLIRLEGLDPTSEKVRAVSVVFLHRPAAIYVAGKPSPLPRYRFVPSVPEGQYNDQSRAEIVRQVAEAVARAEGGSFDDVAPRVWVFPTEIEDGRWGSRGLIRRLPDILGMLVGEEGRKAAERRLANRRRQHALSMLDALRESAIG